MKKILILCLILAILSGCETTTIDDGGSDLAPFRTYKSYIGSFVECRRLEVYSVIGLTVNEEAKSFNKGDVVWRSFWADTLNRELFCVDDNIFLFVEGLSDSIGYYWDVPVGTSGFYFSNGRSPNEPFYLEIRKKYDEYIDIIGDTLFNKRLRGDERPLVLSIATPLSSIIITADKDFGDDYPAGSDLSSLFTVYFDDPYATIKNGYKAIADTYTEYEEELPYPQSIFKTKLSEVNFPERPFIGNEWRCLLDVPPQQTGEYTFNVKVTVTNGVVIEGTVPPINIKGSKQ
jgi:hypothetical protein